MDPGYKDLHFWFADIIILGLRRGSSWLVARWWQQTEEKEKVWSGIEDREDWEMGIERAGRCE